MTVKNRRSQVCFKFAFLMAGSYYDAGIKSFGGCLVINEIFSQMFCHPFGVLVFIKWAFAIIFSSLRDFYHVENFRMSLG